MNPVIAMLIGVIVMMVLIIFTRMHAFPSLIISAILIGILSGVPLGESISTVTSGFGGTMASIGTVSYTHLSITFLLKTPIVYNPPRPL